MATDLDQGLGLAVVDRLGGHQGDSAALLG
jgi:hypothetical protein